MLTKVKRVKNKPILKGALDKEQRTKLKLKVSDCKVTLSSQKGYFKFEFRRENWVIFFGSGAIHRTM